MKLLYLFLFSYVSLFSLEIDIKKSSDLTISDKEIAAFIYLLKSERVSIDEKDARRVIKENRFLADNYLELSTFSPIERDKIALKLERTLAYKYIQYKQNQITISDDVLYSYYKDKKNDFKVGKKIRFQKFTFNTFNKALDFYQNNQNATLKSMMQYATKNTITSIEQIYPIKYMPQALEVLLNTTTKANVLLAPQKVSTVYLVIYVEEISDSNNYIPYVKVKQKIKNILLNKTKRNTRMESLKELKNK